MQKSRIMLTACTLATAIVMLAACSSSDHSSSNASGGSGSSSGGPDLAAAQAFLAPWEQQPDFPITEALTKPVPPDSRIVYLDVGTPQTGLIYTYMQKAAALVGVKIDSVKTGQDPQSIAAALNSVVENPPDAVIDLALDPALWSDQLNQLRDKGVKVIALSVTDGTKFGFPDNEVIGTNKDNAVIGQQLAATAIQRTNGKATNFVFYGVPELPFSASMLEGAKARMAELCPSCKLRVVNIPVAQLGNQAPNTIVSDLQAHPETEYYITSTDETTIGLPSAQTVAGIHVLGVGASPSPINLQQIKQGGEDVALATDTQLYAWMGFDQTLRALIGQTFNRISPEKFGYVLSHPVTKDNLQNTQTGWTTFQDYQSRFGKLWGAQ